MSALAPCEDIDGVCLVLRWPTNETRQAYRQVNSLKVYVT